MSELLTKIIFIAANSNGNDTFWIQMLILVILVASFGVFSLIKTKSNRGKEQQQDYTENVPSGVTKRRWKWQIQSLQGNIAHQTAVARQSLAKNQKMAAKLMKEQKLRFGDTNKKKAQKDLQSGMELLELDFLLSVVEDTQGDDSNTVTMRKLSFDELVRRDRLHTVDSNALKVYAKNTNSLYGKTIQCKAIEELTERTAHRGK
jgi:hypothetical protein